MLNFSHNLHFLQAINSRTGTFSIFSVVKAHVCFCLCQSLFLPCTEVARPFVGDCLCSLLNVHILLFVTLEYLKNGGGKNQGGQRG